MYCPWPCLMCICLNNFQMVCQSQEHAACAFENAVFEKLSEYQGHHHHHHHHDLNTTTDILSHNHSSIFDAPSPPSHPSPLIPLLSSHPLTPLSLSLCGWPSSQYPLISPTHPPIILSHPTLSSHPLTPLSLSLCGWPSSQYPLIPLTHPTHPFISSLFSHPSLPPSLSLSFSAPVDDHRPTVETKSLHQAHRIFPHRRS